MNDSIAGARPMHFQRHAQRSRIAIGIAIVLLAPCMAHAQDARSVSELEAEVARLQQLLEQKRQEQVAGATQAPAEATIAASETVSGGGASSDAAGAGQIEGVVVVGDREVNRREQLKDVPLAVSTITGEELEREQSLDLNSMTRRSASIQFNQNNTRGASLSVRGLGRRSFTETQDPSVGLTVDGVSYGLTQLGNFDFFDIDSVEVRRGPQGTLGGKEASAGSVSISTRRPSFERSADFSLTAGQRDALLAKASFGGSLVDDLVAWRGSFVADRGRGFYESAYDPNYSFYNRNRFGGRVQLLVTPPKDGLTVRLSADLDPKAPQVENGLTFRHDQPFRFADGSLTDPNGTTPRARLAGFTNANGVFTDARSLLVGRTYSADGRRNAVYTYDDYVSNRLLQNENQGQTVTNMGLSAEVKYDMGDHSVTSVTAWRSYSFDAHNDEGTPFDINRNGGGGVDYQQYSQELRYESLPGDTLEYTAGSYFLMTDDVISAKTGWGSDAGAWFATNAQYNTLERNAGVNRAAGIALLSDSLNDAYTLQETRVDTKSTALFGQLTWHTTPSLDFTAGVRVTREDRSTEDEKLLAADGTGSALNPVAVRGVQLGGFDSTAAGTVASGLIGAGNSNNIGFLNTADPAQVAMANAVAQRYFGVASYGQLTGAQAAQVAAAKAVRAGQVGALSAPVNSTYRDTLLTTTLSPTYKINDNYTAYVSWQHGEKSGSALNVNFVNANVKPESTDAYELGLKSSLLGGDLSLSADVYYMDIDNYQAAVRVVDDFTTQTNIANNQANPVAYVTAQGNIDQVSVKGLELDAYYTGIPDVTLRLSGAYTDAKYQKFSNAAFPDEQAFLSTPERPFTEQSGLNLPGISKWTFNVGAEYTHPVLGDKLFRASFNSSYNSRFNNTDTLSSFGVFDAYSRTDASIGLRFSNSFDFGIVGRNLFDDRTHEEGFATYSPYPYPRWFGITVSGKLY